MIKQGKPHLPRFDDFEEKFEQAFGRELTREERRFYRLINIVLEEEFPNPYRRAGARYPNFSSRALRFQRSAPLAKTAPFARLRSANPVFASGSGEPLKTMTGTFGLDRFSSATT